RRTPPLSWLRWCLSIKLATKNRMTRLFTKIRRVTEADLPLLAKIAEADKNAVICPTHCVMRDDYVIGYLSVGSVPLVLMWMDTQRANIRDSMTAVNFFENLASERGASLVAIPCNEDSPFRGYIEQAGYLDIKSKLFVKPI